MVETRWLQGLLCRGTQRGSAKPLPMAGKETLGKRDSDIFALHFISSSGPKKMLQQIFFLCCLEHFNPHQKKIVSHFLPTSHPQFWVLFSSHVPMAQGTFHFIISYHVCSSKGCQGTSWASSDCDKRPECACGNLGLIPGSAEFLCASISPYTLALAFNYFIEMLHLKQWLAHESRDLLYLSLWSSWTIEYQWAFFLCNIHANLQKVAHHLQPYWATAMFVEGRSGSIAELLVLHGPWLRLMLVSMVQLNTRLVQVLHTGCCLCNAVCDFSSNMCHQTCFRNNFLYHTAAECNLWASENHSDVSSKEWWHHSTK